MPGFVGVINQSGRQPYVGMDAALEFLVHNDVLNKKVHCEHPLTLAQTFVDEDATYHHVTDSIDVYVDGYLIGVNAKDFCAELVFAYGKGDIQRGLRRVDGQFVCLLVDKKNNKLLIITDRLGLKPLYYYQQHNQIAFCAEVKGLLALSSSPMTISPLAFDCFVDLGYLLGDMTWFEQIKLAPPASVLEIDLLSLKMSRQFYWTWGDIEQSCLTIEQATEQLYKTFMQAVESRILPDKVVGLPLSGGLDSRLLLAAVDQLAPQSNGFCFTFGTSDCDDMIIAKYVASISAFEHREYGFNSDCWFNVRREQVWRADGSYSLQHMHGSAQAAALAKQFEYTFNGFLGDVIFGASYIEKHKNYFDMQTDKELMKVLYKQNYLFSFRDPDYLAIKKAEPYIIMNRGRRFINNALAHGAARTNHALPFIDRQVLELVYSLPDEYRVNNKVYTSMVLKFFPDFFEKIPWQKTRKNLDGSVGNLLPEKPNQKGYINYAGAIREKESLAFLIDLLGGGNSLYRNFTDCDADKVFLQPHLNDISQNHIAKILNFATAEIYLRELSRLRYI